MIRRSALLLALSLFAVACATSQAPPPRNECLRGTLGIEPDDISREFRATHHVPDDVRGALVALAIDGGPAAAAGVRQGDILLKISTRPVTNSCDAVDRLFDGRCQPVPVEIWREGKLLTMTLAPTPEQRFLRAKCDAGVAASCFRRAWLLWSGTGSPADEGAALKMYRDACDRGWAEACAFLGIHLLDTEEAATSEIVHVLERACELRSSAGCAHLAYLYATGTRVARDDARATPLYVRSCDLGDPLGCYNVGLMYNAGRGVPADVPRAIAAYDEGCRGGSASACSDLGWFYQNGSGVAKDELRALQLYRKSCESTACQSANRRGCVNLGLVYRDGIGIEKDPAQAAEIFEKACHDEPASDDPDARESRAHACSLFAVMFLEGSGVEKDPALGRTYSIQGCDGGDGFGCFNAAVTFAYGLGSEVDMSAAATYYERACGYDDGESCYELSQLYAKGSGVEKNASRAEKLAATACTLGFEKACGK